MLARAFGAGALSSRSTSTSWTISARPSSSRRSRCAWPGRCSAGPPARPSACCSTRISGSPPRTALSALFALILLALFWYYRLGDNPVIRPGKTRPSNPLVNIGRFVSQPRLRLAWLIAFGRSCFWTTFFVYGPILMVVTGEGKLAGGLLVSAGNALLFAAIFWGRVAKRFGARRTMALGLPGDGRLRCCSPALPAKPHPLWAAVFLLVCALFTIALDALGSSAFMRAVRTYERPQMSAVYRTYLDLSDLLPPLVYSIVLAFFGLGAVFATLGVFCAVCGLLTWRYLPKSM